MTDAERLEARFTGTGRNDRGVWVVWVDGRYLSGHTSHTAARAAYRNVVEAASRFGQVPLHGK